MVKTINDINDPALYHVLSRGGLAVLRTDTLYGVLARADDEAAVERVYQLKHRDQAKSPIVLVADAGQMFDELPASQASLADQPWPARTSIILPSTDAPEWLRRGNDSIAYRVPDDEALRRLLAETGPLIAPSANPEGLAPAMTVQQAIDYFGEAVDIYVDGGQVADDTPSRLLRVGQAGEMERLR